MVDASVSKIPSQEVVALIDSGNTKDTEKALKALMKLQSAFGNRVSVLDVGAVAEDVEALTLAVADAQIVLLQSESATRFPELFGWIRSLRPLADIWQIASTPRAPEVPEAGFDDALGMELFNAVRLKPLRERIERRLRQKSLLASMGIISRSARMGLIAETIDRVAPTDASVLIVGPSGSGKELIARALHQHSRRSAKPFVALNCGAIPEGLIESELFGHKKGAFTGSVGARSGYFSQADSGTIFLDEIGEMKPEMQVKLLRALEEGAFYPLGSDRPISVDVRTVSATNRELEQAISEGQFRDDLYYRLAAVKISLPSLSERPEDIVPLLAWFAAGSQLRGFSDEALKALEEYYWPGNVRQLKNFVTGIAALLGDSEVGAADVKTYIAEQQFSSPTLPVVSQQQNERVGMDLVYQALMQLGTEVKSLRELIVANLPNKSSQAVQSEYPSSSPAAHVGEPIILGTSEPTSVDSVEGMEAKLIGDALRITGGNRRIAAEKLGIGERTLYRKMKKYGLS